MTTATEVEPPTENQLRVLVAIAEHYAEHGCGPTTRELMAALGFASTNSVTCHLRPLAKRKLIEWRPAKNGGRSPVRNIVITAIRDATKQAAAEYLSTLKGA